MHHTTLTSSTSNLSRHIQETLDLPVQIAIGHITSILAPFTAKHTSLGCLLRHRRHRVAHQRQSSSLIQPSSLARTSGKDLVQKGCVDDSDSRLVVENKGDGDAEHGKEVSVVDCAV